LKFLSLVLTAILLLISGCAQPDGAVGSSVGTDLNGTTRVITAPIEADTSYIAETVSTGSSPYLYVGSAAGVTSSSLLSFDLLGFPPVDSIVTIDAKLSLSHQGSIGADRGLNVDHKLSNYYWEESDPPSWEELSQVIMDTTFSSISIAEDSASYEVNVPHEWVRSWLRAIEISEADTSAEDTLKSIPLTVSLSAEEPGGISSQIVRFRSRGALGDSIKPKLELILGFMSVDSTGSEVMDWDTLSIFPSRDSYILKHEPIDPRENLIVGSGVNFQSNLRFDLSDLWQAQDEFHIVVNRATLLLHKVPDDDNILPILLSISPFKLTDSTGFTFPDSAAYAGFAFFSTAIDSALDTLQIIVTSPVVDWATGPEFNFGLSLHSSSQGLDINRSAYYSSSHPDPSMRPRLSIYYTELVR